METREELLQGIKEKGDRQTLRTAGKLIEQQITQCHKANETNRGDDVLLTQGEIRAYRAMLKIFSTP